MAKKIYVIAQHDGEQISLVTHELLAFAGQVEKALSFSVTLIIMGENLSSLAGELVDWGGSVILIEVPGLTHYHGGIYKQVLSNFFATHEPALICTAHTAQGMDYSPGLAVQLKAAHISGVQGFEMENGTLNFLRAMDNGKQMAWITPVTDRVVVSLRPGVCKPLPLDSGRMGSLFVHHMEGCRKITDTVSRNNGGGTKYVRFKGVNHPHTDLKGLGEAEAIIAVGNGIGSDENLDMIHEMASFFHKSAVGGSRIVCDRGQLGYGQQVGLTGAVVAPKLYMAWGISGASQHIAGMEQSEFVVSINKDATAPMMNIADVCIVEDLNQFLPLCLACPFP